MYGNLLTSCWGPVGWAFLHSVTFGYPEKPTKAESDAYRRYFESLGAVLPCDTCRENYQKNLRDLPLERFLGSRKDLTYWGYLLHEKVNDELGVPKAQRLSFEDVRNYYESMRTQACDGVCSDPSSKKRCKVQYITEGKENFENTVFRKNWPLILAIVILILIRVVRLFARIRPRR